MAWIIPLHCLGCFFFVPQLVCSYSDHQIIKSAIVHHCFIDLSGTWALFVPDLAIGQLLSTSLGTYTALPLATLRVYQTL